eukprot:9835-Heterococcus_DN1.PRE.2
MAFSSVSQQWQVCATQSSLRVHKHHIDSTVLACHTDAVSTIETVSIAVVTATAEHTTSTAILSPRYSSSLLQCSTGSVSNSVANSTQLNVRLALAGLLPLSCCDAQLLYNTEVYCRRSSKLRGAVTGLLRVQQPLCRYCRDFSVHALSVAVNSVTLAAKYACLLLSVSASLSGSSTTAATQGRIHCSTMYSATSCWCVESTFCKLSVSGFSDAMHTTQQLCSMTRGKQIML